MTKPTPDQTGAKSRVNNGLQWCDDVASCLLDVNTDCLQQLYKAITCHSCVSLFCLLVAIKISSYTVLSLISGIY